MGCGVRRYRTFGLSSVLCSRPEKRRKYRYTEVLRHLVSGSLCADSLTTIQLFKENQSIVIRIVTRIVIRIVIRVVIRIVIRIVIGVVRSGSRQCLFLC